MVSMMGRNSTVQTLRKTSRDIVDGILPSISFWARSVVSAGAPMIQFPQRCHAAKIGNNSNSNSNS